MSGTGKWSGIVGNGNTIGSIALRADDHSMPTWQQSWRIDK